LSPAYPKKYIGDDKEEETDKGRQEMEEVTIAHDKVDANGTSESGAAHERYDLDKTSAEFCISRHEEK